MATGGIWHSWGRWQLVGSGTVGAGGNWWDRAQLGQVGRRKRSKVYGDTAGSERVGGKAEF